MRGAPLILAGLLLAFPARAQEGCRPLASLPLRSERGHVLVEVAINDQPAWFAVDTGASNSVMSAALAERLGLSIARYPSLTAADISGSRSGKLTYRIKVSLGGQRVGNMRRFFVADDLHVDGLLAGDLLGVFDIDLDFAQARLNLFARGACSAPPGAGPFQAITAAVMEGRVHAPVTLDGRDYWTVVDTGAPRSYIAASKALADFGVPMDRDKAGKARGAYGGALLVMPQEFRSLRIGNFELAKPRLSLTSPETGFRDAPIVLGLEHLSALRLFIAYGARRLYISPARQP